MEEQAKTLGPGVKVALFGVFVAIWLGLCFLLNATWSPFHLGGWGMWPILAVCMVFVIITIERIKYLFFEAKPNTKEFVAEVEKHLMEGKVSAAVAHCNSQIEPVAKIVGAGLANMHLADRDVQDAVDDAALYHLPRLEKRTGYLAMIGNIATLLGLLGTIVGLITSFAGVSLQDANDPTSIARAQNYVHLVPKCQGTTGKALVQCIGGNKATILAKGISEAMNCTAFGLAVGILSLLAFSFLNGRTQLMLDDINDTTVYLMNLAVTHRTAMQIDAPASGGAV